MSNLTVSTFFTQNNGVPATGLTLVDIDLYLTEQNKSTGVDIVIWDGTQNPTEEIDNVGAYTRIYAAADFETNNYFARGSYTGATDLDVDHVQGGTTVETDVIADGVLKRGVVNVEDTADTTSLSAVILAMLESAIVDTTWTIRKTDGTVFVVKTAIVDATADPITGVT